MSSVLNSSSVHSRRNSSSNPPIEITITDSIDFNAPELLESDKHESLIALWSARIYLDSQYHKNAYGRAARFGLPDVKDLSRLLGIQLNTYEEDSRAYIPVFTARANQIDIELSTHLFETMGFNGLLGKNLRELKTMLGLPDTDYYLLGFFCILHHEKNWAEFTEGLGDINRRILPSILSKLLNLPETEINKAIANDSKLFQTGLMRLNLKSRGALDSKVEFLSGFIDSLLVHSPNPLEMLTPFFYASAPAELSLNDFPHLAKESEDLIKYIKAKLTTEPCQGVNILIYGEPGTGKTQWVKALSAQLNTALYDISAEDSDGEAIGRFERVGAYRLSQAALGQQDKNLILFDEVEDLFGIASPRRGFASKAWFNNILESNPVPAFWVINNIGNVDPAFIRRFDRVIEMQTPPKSVRLSLLKRICEPLNLRECWLDALAEQQTLVPAVIGRAAKVLALTHDKTMPAEEVENTLLDRLNQTLKAQYKDEIYLTKVGVNSAYQLDWVNTQADLAKIVDGFKKYKKGRICLYGLPGTGKTAFGHYLADKLDLPLFSKKASDIISCYVGETERNIAEAFKYAKKEGAILQLDEADTFLQSRESARQRWEVSQVNELLTQMESFEGIFIASTNLMGVIDAAAMRRFDVKLEFKPLTAEQAWLMFENLFKEKPLEKCVLQTLQTELAQLSNLTPGDFAVVKRQMNLGFQDLDPHLAIQTLKEECRLKPSYALQNGIGFMSQLT